MKRWFIRATLILLGTLTGVALVVWLLWIPSPQEPAYRFVGSWGGPGDEPGRFHDPTGIAVAVGEVYVSDARNGRIQVFDYQGGFNRQFGGQGSESDRLGRPMDLALHDGKLYVADYWKDRISVFTPAGDVIRHIGEPGKGPGQFNGPGGVAVAPDGSIYVADFYNQRIQLLKPQGGFIRQWGTTGGIGSAAGEFNYPTDVALYRDRLYVADGYNDRVQVFDSDGALLHKWGGPLAMNIFGAFPGWFATVTSVAVGPEGDLFAADFYNHRVQKFTSSGEFLTAFGEHGDGPGRFHHVTAVAVALGGTVFAADFGNHRVSVWRPPATGDASGASDNGR
jgi:DNA-binding beta-propeller fold protein YncE